MPAITGNRINRSRYQISKAAGLDYFRSYDYILLAAVLLLSALGLLVLSSATSNIPNGGSMMIKQVAGLIIGVSAAILISFFDYIEAKGYMALYYIATAVLLTAVLFIGKGEAEFGSSSWIDLGFFSFQPSEFAKISFIFIVATFLERLREEKFDKKNLYKLIGFAALPIVLILLEPDAGTALVYMFILGAMVFIFGLRLKYIIATLATVLAVSPLIYFFVLKDYQKLRILALLFPGSDTQGSTYQIDNSFMAIGSGGLFGKGLFKGILTQSGAVPVRQSDFIFAVIGEELGFVGAMVFISLIIFIIARAIRIAQRSSDRFGTYIATGIAAMFTFHFFVNIGMCIGLLPVSGLPLPFVSYGGTAMISNYLGIGFLLSISLRQKRPLYAHKI